MNILYRVKVYYTEETFFISISPRSFNYPKLYDFTNIHLFIYRTVVFSKGSTDYLNHLTLFGEAANNIIIAQLSFYY